jgi:hypothetical protein
MLKKVSIFFLLLLLLFALSGCDQFYFKDYEASGKVEDSSGTGIQGATINFSDGSSVKSLSDGTWKQTGLKGDIEITPKKSDYTFTPTAHQLSQLDENKNNIIFKAESNGTDSSDGESDGEEDGSDEKVNLFELSGIVKDVSENGLSNVIIQFNNGEFSSVVTAEDGSWEKEGLSGRVEVRAEKYGYIFEPATRSLETSDKNVNYKAIAQEQSFMASGTVSDANNNPIVDVTIRFNDGEFGSVKTDAAGEWTKEGLIGDVNVAPSKYGYTFEPDNLPVSAEDQNIDFTAIKEEVEYTASGNITDQAGNPLPDVIVNFSNGSSVKTDFNGNWEKTGLVGESTVTPELDDWQFVPANITLNENYNEAYFVAQTAEHYDYYTLSGKIENNGGANIHIEIRSADDNKLIANAITKDDGTWVSTSIWGSVVVTPKTTGSIIGFTPPNQRFSGEETEVNFRADY